MYFNENDFKSITAYIQNNFEELQKFKVIENKGNSFIRSNKKFYILNCKLDKIVLETNSRIQCSHFIKQQNLKKFLKKK